MVILYSDLAEIHRPLDYGNLVVHGKYELGVVEISVIFFQNGLVQKF